MDARNKDTMWTLLHTACHTGQHRVVEVLVSAGAKLESEVEGRYNPLLLCCSCGSCENVVCTVTMPVPTEDDIEDPEYFNECGHIKVSIRLERVHRNRHIDPESGQVLYPAQALLNQLIYNHEYLSDLWDRLPVF